MKEDPEEGAKREDSASADPAGPANPAGQVNPANAPEPGSAESFTRRHFLELVGVGAVGIAAAGSLALSARYLTPNVVREPPTRFRAGRPEEFPPGSVVLDKEQRVFIVRAKEGYFYALSAVCTHLGCIANWKSEEGIIACPCHGSKFNREGDVIAGPAPRSLPRFLLTVDDHGQLVVDKAVTVGEDVTLKI